MKHYDLIILGGGATGASSLYHLAKRGMTDSLLIEMKDGFGKGATGSWGSLVRVFHSSLEVTKKACVSVPFYLEFEDQVGATSHFHRSGSLYFIKLDQKETFRDHLFALETHRVQFELILPDEGRKRFPEYNWYEDDLAIFEPNAGTACPWATTEALIGSAKKLGADATLNCRVTEIVVDKGKVTGVKTSAGESIGCNRLVLASGIWTKNLLEKIGSTIDIFPEVIQLNRFCHKHSPTTHPMMLDLTSRSFGHLSYNGSFIGGYLKPEPEVSERKRAVQHVSLAEAAIAKKKIASRLSWIQNATLEGGLRAIESYGRNKFGLIEKDPLYDNILVATGWSCGGFTTAPENGRRIAESLSG